MTRKEFLDLLESSLTGQVPPSVVASNLQYYRDYIAGEVAKGRSEESVLEELGDPRLIARTIISAAGAAGGRGFEEAGRTNGRPEQKAYRGQNGRSSHGSSWKWILILLVVMLLVLSLVTRVIFLVLRLLLSPIFWVFIVLAFGAGYFFRRR